MSLFDEVNFATLPRLRGLLEEWFPAGRLSGSEFECGDLNGNAGRSFKVNLNTGRWADFAGDVKGGDPVSLYAALHNLEQGEAARKLASILGIEVASNGHHPSTAENGAGCLPVSPVPADAPDVDVAAKWFYAKLAGDRDQWRFDYRGMTGRWLFSVYRFETESGKEIRPISFWRDPKTGESAWSPKWPASPLPLYGLEELAQHPDLLVLSLKAS